MSLKSRQQSVIDSGYAKEILEFAINEHGADIELLSQALVKSKRLPDRYDVSWNDDNWDDDWDEYPVFEDEELAYYYYMFALRVKGANIDLLCDAIIGEKDPYYIYLFARDVEGANIEKLEDALIDVFVNELSYNDEIIYDFAMNVKGAHPVKLQKALVYASFTTIYKFAHDVKGADIDYIQNIMLDNINDIFFEGYFDNDDYEAIHEFMLNIKGANVDKIFNRNINNYKSMYFLYLVAKDVNGVDIEQIENRMIKLMDFHGVYYLESLIDEVEGVDVNKIKRALEDYLDRNKHVEKYITNEYQTLLDKLNNQMKLELK